MSRPLYMNNLPRQVAGLKGQVNRLERRPFTNEWQRPDAFLYYGDEEGVDEVDLLVNGWTQGDPVFRFRWHMDGSWESEGYLQPGSSGTVAFTCPGAEFDDDNPGVDYRVPRDASYLTNVQTGPSTFSIARVELDATTGDVTITYPAS